MTFHWGGRELEVAESQGNAGLQNPHRSVHSWLHCSQVPQGLTPGLLICEPRIWVPLEASGSFSEVYVEMCVPPLEHGNQVFTESALF